MTEAIHDTMGGGGGCAHQDNLVTSGPQPVCMLVHPAILRYQTYTMLPPEVSSPSLPDLVCWLPTHVTTLTTPTIQAYTLKDATVATLDYVVTTTSSEKLEFTKNLKGQLCPNVTYKMPY